MVDDGSGKSNGFGEDAGIGSKEIMEVRLLAAIPGSGITSFSGDTSSGMAPNCHRSCTWWARGGGSVAARRA